MARPKKPKEDTVTLHLKLKPESVELLNKLAGGERHKSAYLDRIIPLLYEATEAGKQHQSQAFAEAFASVLAKGAVRG